MYTCHLLQKKSQRGQSLIELMVAIALTAILLPALLTGIVASREGRAQEIQRLGALQYLKESEEALRSVRESGWSAVTASGTYHPEVSGSGWSLVSGSEVVGGNYTRSIIISDVQRDSGGTIVSTGGTVDPSTKQVVSTVSWTSPIAGSVSSTTYVARYLGNTTMTQTTQADFDLGSFSNTQSTADGGGTVELSPGSGNLSFTDDYSTASSYSYDANKIEVTGGYAQLMNQGGAVSGQTSNSDFDLGTTGWTFSRTNQNVGQAGSWISSGGNPNGYMQINFPATKNKTAGGYYYQSFTTTAANPTATLSFQWKVTAYQATPTTFHLYAFIDTSSGSPTVSQNVWDSGLITSTTNWSGTVSVDIASKVQTAGTYYVKLMGYVEYANSTQGPYTIGFDNTSVSWSGTSTSYASDEPTVTETTSFTDANLTSWDSFTATEVTNGGSVMYQISDDDGLTWWYFLQGNPGNWALATLPGEYNDASTIDQKIRGFPTTNKKLRVRAFLIGDGTQQVKLDSVVIGYTSSSGNNAGTFTSGTMDAGSSVSFNAFVWTETNTANTTTKLQVATNTDNSTWDYLGPDGTASTYYTGGTGSILLNQISGRYFRYKIQFQSSTNDRPNVSDVTVNYSP